MRSFFRAERLHKSFGAVKALNGCSFEVFKGDILGIVGPNGAGKTVTLNVICGELKAEQGKVSFKSSDITGLPPYEIVKLGISRTFQLTRIYPEMTVLENMLFAAQRKEFSYNFLQLLKGRLSAHIDVENRERAFDLLEILELFYLRDARGKELSYGQRKLLELANALITYPEPQIVMLDEPLAGINPVMTEKIADYIRKFQEMGITFVIVEHNVRLLTDLCNRMVVLAQGKKIAEGPPKDVRRDPVTIDAYFGE
jgi:ABC-type branched-subunit amino acid transport system ATPase component